MASSLSNRVNRNEETHKIKCKFKHDDKNVKLAELNISIRSVFLNTQTLKIIKWNTNVYVVTKIINKILMKS